MPEGTMKFGTSNNAGKDATTLFAAVRRQNNVGDDSTLIVMNTAATGDPGDRGPIAIDARAANYAIWAEGKRVGLVARCADDGEYGAISSGPTGISASSTKGLEGVAAVFHGKVQVLGSLSKAGGGFKIDRSIIRSTRKKSTSCTRLSSHRMH